MQAYVRFTVPMRVLRLFGLALMPFLLTSAAGAQASAADEEYAAGMAANEKGHVEEAPQHLQRAIDFDPQMIKAHFALGTVAGDDCERSDPTDSSAERCKLGIAQYKRVLELDASREDAVKDLAYALYAINDLDESESYYRKALVLDANDPEVLCGIAASDAHSSYRVEVIARVEHEVPVQKPLIDTPFCQEVREKALPGVEEGMELLARALDIKKRSTQLMGFLSLLYVDRAEIQCGNPKAYKADMSAARKWSHREQQAWRRKTDDHSIRKCPPAPPPMPNNK